MHIKYVIEREIWEGWKEECQHGLRTTNVCKTKQQFC